MSVNWELGSPCVHWPLPAQIENYYEKFVHLVIPHLFALFIHYYPDSCFAKFREQFVEHGQARLKHFFTKGWDDEIGSRARKYNALLRAAHGHNWESPTADENNGFRWPTSEESTQHTEKFLAELKTVNPAIGTLP